MPAKSLRLVRVLKGFHLAGIPVMPLKGPTLSAEVYGDERLRQYRDLDLAVTPDDLPRAQAELPSLDMPTHGNVRGPGYYH